MRTPYLDALRRVLVISVQNEAVGRRKKARRGCPISLPPGFIQNLLLPSFRACYHRHPELDSGSPFTKDAETSSA
ncbi:MAG: hypothetical protein J5930_08445 [Treponema sp.]|nr:hypothetical protein [Treponema sp.]